MTDYESELHAALRVLLAETKRRAALVPSEVINAAGVVQHHLEQGAGLGLPDCATPAPQCVPAGFVLVPKEPTPEMYRAACQAFAAWAGTTTEQPDFTHCDSYRAMIAAAPAPTPVKEGADL